ncbi:MAG TPA: hypothetical protein VG055_00325 [Planctomycetaceae bacterium]|jgi:hypothetical protein|nr:hypothetical protein [Planctomycetaceae bacterium]
MPTPFVQITVQTTVISTRSDIKEPPWMNDAVSRSCSAPRHRQAFLDPRFPQRRLVGDGSGRLIAAEVDAERHHLAARIKELTLSQFF